jgi:antitoxin component YwqK of YwqJK toxin-antitoxin module
MKSLIIVVILTLLNFTITNAQKIYQKNFDENNNLISEGWVENNKKVQYWHFYYPNGKIKKEGHYQSGMQTKYWRFFSSSGSLKMEGYFVDGQKSNWWLFYDSMERINHKCQLRNNKKNGYCLMYNNDKLVAASKYKAGKKLKEWTTFASFKSENKLSDLQ